MASSWLLVLLLSGSLWGVVLFRLLNHYLASSHSLSPFDPSPSLPFSVLSLLAFLSDRLSLSKYLVWFDASLDREGVRLLQLGGGVGGKGAAGTAVVLCSCCFSSPQGGPTRALFSLSEWDLVVAEAEEGCAVETENAVHSASDAGGSRGKRRIVMGRVRLNADSDKSAAGSSSEEGLVRVAPIDRLGLPLDTLTLLAAEGFGSADYVRQLVLESVKHCPKLKVLSIRNHSVNDQKAMLNLIPKGMVIRWFSTWLVVIERVL
jgi:hypothetical protein